MRTERGFEGRVLNCGFLSKPSTFLTRNTGGPTKKAVDTAAHFNGSDYRLLYNRK